MQELQYAMRRAGQNPTESEVQDMVNKIDDGSSSLNFEVNVINPSKSRGGLIVHLPLSFIFCFFFTKTFEKR